MTKRIIAVFLVVFMILVFSVSAFAAIDFGFEICSSDGTQTLYFQESTCLTSLTVTETGALLEYLSPMDSTKTLTYTFTYNGESFSGFATSANAETAVYTVGNTYTSFGSSVSLYVVESSAGGTTSVTIPVSGAWKFHDTLVFSSLSSSLT